MTLETLLLERIDNVAIISLNRPQKLNALNEMLLKELSNVLHELKLDKSIRVIMITGTGEKAFAAGADLEEIAGKNPIELWHFLRRGQEVFKSIEKLGKPVIGVINGMALGGGAELALACTIRIATENASFSFPEAGLGGLPGYGGTQRLPKIIGQSLALEYLLTGESISAQLAQTIHLVNQVVVKDDLMKASLKLAKKLATKAPASVEMVINAVSGSIEIPSEWGNFLESSLASLCSSTDDSKEGIAAIFEKRKPVFIGK